MFLTDWEILERVEKGDIQISPFDVSLVNSCSLDFRLGGTLAEVKKSYSRPNKIEQSFGLNFGIPFIDPSDPLSFQSETFQIPLRGFVLEPMKFILAGMYETIKLPPDVIALIMGKSTLGRLGLGNSHVSGLINPKFNGGITLELVNHSENPILLTAGMLIGQMSFVKINTPKFINNRSKYINQRPCEGSKGL